MSRHVVKSAISVNCVKSYGEADVVKLVFAMARYILNMRKGTNHMLDLAKKHNIKYVKIFQGGTYVRD